MPCRLVYCLMKAQEQKDRFAIYIYMFQKRLLKWIHNLVDFANHTWEVAWLILYTLVLTSHETFHCMTIVLVLRGRVSPISGRRSSNNSVPFFKHLLSFCCVTDTAMTQAEWYLTWNSLWNSSLGSYTGQNIVRTGTIVCPLCSRKNE